MSTTIALPAPIALTLTEHVAGRLAVSTAHLIIAALGRRPVQMRRVLSVFARHAGSASYDQAARARDVVTTLSPRCGSGYGCLPRSIACALLCRTQGTWPAWMVGVRYPPLRSHAWTEAGGIPVSENPVAIASLTVILTVPAGGHLQ